MPWKLVTEVTHSYSYTDKTWGCGSKDTILALVFQLVESTQKNWLRIRGFQHLALDSSRMVILPVSLPIVAGLTILSSFPRN
jgi:hypothetical protein